MGDGEDRPAAAVDWVAARTRYERGDETVAAIAESLGVTPQGLTARARRDGWTLRRKGRPRAPATRETIARLKSLLQQRLAGLEGQLGALGEEATAATSERDIRAANTLVRTLEKVLELERKDRTQRARQRKQHRRLDDAEREALAHKLEGLHRELHADSDLAQPADPRGEGSEP
jgi:uncharacterized protein YjcR